nr:MAG TPA: hypothetical protein [Caudoviricetes sp.]
MTNNHLFCIIRPILSKDGSKFFIKGIDYDSKSW